MTLEIQILSGYNHLNVTRLNQLKGILHPPLDNLITVTNRHHRTNVCHYKYPICMLIQIVLVYINIITWSSHNCRAINSHIYTVDLKRRLFLAIFVKLLVQFVLDKVQRPDYIHLIMYSFKSQNKVSYVVLFLNTPSFLLSCDEHFHNPKFVARYLQIESKTDMRISVYLYTKFV